MSVPGGARAGGWGDGVAPPRMLIADEHGDQGILYSHLILSSSGVVQRVQQQEGAAVFQLDSSL